jgi:hypothetical protein
MEEGKIGVATCFYMILSENYIILLEYIKRVLPPLIKVVGPTINLISGTHNFCERKEYAFNVLPEYSIIIRYYQIPCTSNFGTIPILELLQNYSLSFIDW